MEYGGGGRPLGLVHRGHNGVSRFPPGKPAGEHLTSSSSNDVLPGLHAAI